MPEGGIDAMVDDRIDIEEQLLPSPPTDNTSASSRTGEMMRNVILVHRFIRNFTAGINHGSRPVTRASSSKSIDNSNEPGEIVRIEIMEEDDCEVVDEAQTALLHKPADDTLNLRQQIYQQPEFAEAGDSLAASSEHRITIGQTITNEMTFNQPQHSHSINMISKIVREKNLLALEEFGGLSEVANTLKTNLVTGISNNQATYRSGPHAFTQSPTSACRFSQLVWEALKSKTILLLSLGAALSLGFGIKEEGLENGWYDGVIVLIAIIFLVLFASIRKYWQERRARKKLEKPTEGRVGEVHVIRGGEAKYICESELVCGDIVSLKKVCLVPADGLFVAGEALELYYGSESYIINGEKPFLSYGERVINGDARMVVTSVDMNTGWSEMMSKASSNPDTKFKLEAHLDKLNTCIHNIGLIIIVLILIVLFARYTVGKMDEDYGYRPELKEEPSAMRNFANSFRKIIKESKYTTRALTKLLSVSLVGVTEGVPFVVSLAIFYCNHETLCYKATEQDSQVVAKMASVTRICTDTFGDFTKDEMEVDKLLIGEEVISECITLSPDVIEALCDGIGTTENASLQHWAKDKLGCKRKRIGFKRKRMMESWKTIDRRGENPFNEPCGVLMRGTRETDKMFLHFNGPVKEILKKCTHYFDSKGQKAPMSDEVTRYLDQANEGMMQKQLRTIAFACKCTDRQTLDADDLILVALIGLKAKSRRNTKKAVKACRECGIKTVIVSSQKKTVLHNIARQCGVITDGDSESLVLTGEAFRKYTDEERSEKLDKIRVMAEALPTDKLLLVKSLRGKGEVVAFLGQRTDEAPALRGADIGIAMGTWSSKKARESSEIIMWDGSFVDLIDMVNSGKCIYDNIQSFLQLVLIMTISSSLINFSGTVALGDAPLTMVQLAWVNLAVTFLGGLALLTKPSTDKPVSFVPVSSRRSLITADMARNILAQVLYQAVCLVILQIKGSGVVGASQYINTMVSNSFILCQFFNQFNARELGKKDALWVWELI